MTAEIELNAPDFGGFGAILMEAAALQNALRESLMECPVCAYVLAQNQWGEVNCPLGHYRARKRPNLLEDG